MKSLPNPITVNTGEQELITKTIDDFFLEIKEYIKINYKVHEPNWEIKSGQIAYNSIQVTDDRVTYLSYKDIILAGVFETRTEFNHVHYTFFKSLNGIEELLSKK